MSQQITSLPLGFNLVSPKNNYFHNANLTFMGIWVLIIYCTYSGIRFIGSPVKRVSRFIGPFYLERNHVSTYVYKITPVNSVKYSVYWASKFGATC